MDDQGEHVEPIPEGFHTVTPHLVCSVAAEAIEFYKEAFGAMEVSRLATPDGRLIHAQIQIGDSRLFIVDEFPEMNCFGPRSIGGSPVSIHLYVEDADAFVAHAVASGAELKMPVQDMFWGDRYGQVRDPSGHVWSVATRKQDLSPEQIAEAAKAAFPSDQQAD